MPEEHGLSPYENLLQHLSPLGWEHINLTADCVWRQNKRVEHGKFRPLRISVDLEISDKLKKAKLENGFYNLIDGKRVSAGKTLLRGRDLNPRSGSRRIMSLRDERDLSGEAAIATLSFELTLQLPRLTRFSPHCF
jgi:hypothetical protein